MDDASPKHRLRRVLTYSVVCILLGSLYGVFIKMTGLAIPCVFRRVTGLQCPGCGVTRMCIALLQLDLESAYAAHPMLLIQLPVLVVIMAKALITYIRKGVFLISKIETICLYICIGLLVLFTIFRNILSFI